MHSGVASTPQQTVMIIYNKWSKSPIAVVNGQTKTMGEELMGSIIQAVTSFGAAGITGNFMLKAAEASCPPTALCGTLVQVHNQAGANAGAESNTVQTTNS